VLLLIKTKTSDFISHLCTSYVPLVQKKIWSGDELIAVDGVLRGKVISEVSVSPLAITILDS